MNYQHPSQSGYRFITRQHCHNSPEIHEEPESFIDTVSYSESDGYINILPKVRSVPSHDIQELYFRKPMISSSQILSCAPQGSRCCCNNYWTPAPESMCEHPPFHYAISTGQPVPRRASSAFVSRRNTSSVTNNNYSDSTSFKSSPAIPTGASQKFAEEIRRIPRNKLPAAMTCRTSRASRSAVPATIMKSQNNSIDRQPIFDQEEHPNSGKTSRVSKSQEDRLPIKTEADNLKSRTLPKTTIVNTEIDVRKMNSEGDATRYKPDIECLDTIERIAESLDEDEVEEVSEDHKNEIRRMSKFLVPRVPNSLKSATKKQEEIKSEEVITEGNITHRNVEPNIEPDMCLKKSLHNILDQLENCELSLNNVRAKYNANREKISNRESKKNVEADGIFNLREISAKIAPIPDDEMVSEIKAEDELLSSNDLIQADVSFNSTNSQDPENFSSEFVGKIDSKNSLDDIAALELHRSKSYIINLIDRALSKELGTIPEERISRNQDEFQDLSTVRAVNHIERNRKCRGAMQEMVDREIDLIISPANSNQHHSALSKECQPAFIRQLKELRWGHFKHIQQEVQRLEELERFLDTCGVSCDIY
ncbi:hypothetical protein WA026_016049 [Henosepilachna vigintioctopunctata]|uniref:Uncharacterized protein n=1 Tax=Henosepilachna vigintioctopunctata TaxID=420089 RepID=A0AAW1U8S5_9CUCU